MSQYMFGTGQVYAVPDGGGNPLRLGALQDVSVEFSADIKTLHGQSQFPLAVARGKSKIEGKIGTANIDAMAFNEVYFGQTGGVSAGTRRQAINEVAAIPVTPGPYTVTAANDGVDFYLDLGVTDVLTGQPYKQVSAGPTAGQYSVSNVGVYTFAAADQGKGILLNYLYDDATAGGTLELTNQLMGLAPYFQLIASQIFDGKVFTLCLYKVTAEKLSLPLKQDDFLIPEMGFQAQANDAGSIGFISTTSIAGGGG